MAYYLYHIINKNTGHIYIGRTQNDNQWQMHKHFLSKNQHFCRLLQQHYNRRNTFEFNIIEQNDDPTYIAKKAIETINIMDTTNPMKGYNSFYDSQGTERKTVKLDLYDEDLIFYYLKNDKSKTLKQFNITSNVFDYRTQRLGYGIHGELIPVSTYECLYHYCAQEAVLSPEPISASSLMDRCFQIYNISKRLRPTPHKISKNLKGMGIPQKKKGGLMYFIPNAN